MKAPLIVECVTFEEALAQPPRAVGEIRPEGWDGRAAERLVSALESFRAVPKTV